MRQRPSYFARSVPYLNSHAPAAIPRSSKRRAAALVGVLALAFAGCDLEPTGPQASLREVGLEPALTAEASAIPLVRVSSDELLELTVGQTVRLEFPAFQSAPDPTAGSTAVPTAGSSADIIAEVTPIQVEINATSSNRTEVVVPYTDSFDPRLLVDSTVTLGRAGGPRVGVAVHANGKYIMVGGSPGRPIKYYFHNDDLSPDGSAIDPAELVLRATHAEDGAVRGTSAGVALALEADATWTSSEPEIVSVTDDGIATALAPGSAEVRIHMAGGSSKVRVTVRSAKPTVPPVSFEGDEVVYPSEEVAFLAGPQLKAGSSLNPWPWYDGTGLAMGPRHSARILDARNFTASLRGYTYYYDLGLTQYLLYYRTGDETYRTSARALVDRFVKEQLPKNGAIPPRSAALTGVLLRALDGRPELFDYAVMWADRHERSWLNRFYDRTETRSGIRDPGFTLLYLAQIAAVHPSPAVRADFKRRALLAGRWFTRTQSKDGAWYYGTKRKRYTQPFQAGFLLEGLVATHQLTGDPEIAASIVEAVDWLYRDGFDASYPWEAMFYTVPEDRGKRDKHPGPRWKADATWGYRHLNSPVVHAFGYAYKITGDPKYREQGDHLFEAAFGYDAADPRRSTGLAHDNGKNYNQSYRSSGRYLVWRLGR